MKLQKTNYLITSKTSSPEKPSAKEESRPKQSGASKDQFEKISAAALKMNQMMKPAAGGPKGTGGDLVAAQPIDLPRTPDGGVKGPGGNLVGAQPIDLPRTLGGDIKGSGGDSVAATPINLPKTLDGGVKGPGGDSVAATPINLPRTLDGGVKGPGGDSVAATPINLPKTLDGGVIDPRSSSSDLTPEGNRTLSSMENPEGGEVGVLPIPLPKSSADAMLEIQEDLRELEAMSLNSRIQAKERYVQESSNKSKAGQDSQRAAIKNFRT